MRYCKVCGVEVGSRKHYCEECRVIVDRDRRRKTVYDRSQREDVKEHKKQYMRKYTKRPEVKLRLKKYSQRPEVKERAKRHQMKKTTKERVNKSQVERRRNNFKYRIRNVISPALCRSLKGNKNGRHWEDLVGYTRQELKQHLETLFTEGMSWDNYGKFGWHIDHILPLSFF